MLWVIVIILCKSLRVRATTDGNSMAIMASSKLRDVSPKYSLIGVVNTIILMSAEQLIARSSL